MGNALEKTKENAKQYAKLYAKRKVKQLVKKVIRKVLLKVLKKLALYIGKLLLKAFLSLVALIGIPGTIVFLVITIIGGAILIVAPSLEWFGDDSPITPEEAKKQINQLILDSSELEQYRPPFKLVTAIDAVRILKEDKQPWEIDPEPIVNGLAPDFEYETHEDTYEIKKVIETEVTTYTYSNMGTEGCQTREEISSAFCSEREEHKHIETETIIEKETVKREFLKSAHAWNTLDTFYYKEVDVNGEFAKQSENKEGNTKTTTYKRLIKEWQLDTVNNIKNYEKFDSTITSLQFKDDDINLLVASLIENGIHMDGYTGSYFDVFIENGMGMIVPQEYMEIYIAANKKYGVDWNYLAAHHFIETRFSTMDPMISYVGAEGHMQVRP
ncbi:MAG: hypothetical protein CMJ78_05620 [Planctomycetaceae bacterium]|nr:hypothetical protein [Planctomycetaceae bacterium]